MTYINSRAKLFGHLDRLAAWQRGEVAPPVTVEWDLSNRCPLDCPACHCGHLRSMGPWSERETGGLYEHAGDLADADLVTHGLTEMADAGVKSVVWSGGGEPLMHPRWPDLMAHAAQLELEQGVYTSGITLSDVQAKRLGELARWVVFSMDAADEARYTADKGVSATTWAKLLRHIRLMADVGKATVGVSYLLREDTWAQAEEMLLLARGLGATYATFRPLIETDPDHPDVCITDRRWITKAAPLLRMLAKEPDVELDVPRFEAYRDWTGRSYDTCYGIVLSTVVTPDGRMWDCCQRRGEPGSCLGDLRTESFATIWRRRQPRTDLRGCRVMCRLHLMNETLDAVMARREHGDFL